MERWSSVSIVREVSVRFPVSGKALAAGVPGFNGPAASALPLSYSSNGA